MNCLFPTTRHALGVLVLVAGLSAPATAQTASTTVDTSRIVSIGGAVTEILYALGQDKNIVGVDSTSVFPAQAMKDKANVGYMRQLSAEGVLGLNPSVMIAIAGSGPKETMTVLEAAKVPLIIVPDSYSEAGIVEKINIIGKVTGATARARCLAAQVHDDLAALSRIREGIGAKKRVLFVLSFVSGRAMAAGTHTAADGILRLAGAVNVIGDYEGYKPLSDEAVIAAKPEIIVSIKRGGPGVLDEATVFAHPAFAATPAAAKRDFVAMEGLYLLGFGPRTARAARDLARTLYPDLKGAPLPSETAGGNGACPD